MTLEDRKNRFIKNLENVDEAIMDQLELIINNGKKDWFDSLPISEYQALEQSNQKANENNLTLHEDVMKLFTKWQ